MLSCPTAPSFEIGDPAWRMSDIRASFEEFSKFYKDAPIRNNDGGMKAPHIFASWFILRKIQPSLIVESGVFKGQGTWLLENACPKARLICLDPRLDYREYQSSKAEYHSTDFDNLDFSGEDLENALCFFDDHQSHYERLKSMYWKGFKRAIFEDNYPVGHGDCYSLRHMLSQAGFPGFLPNNWRARVKRVYSNKIQPVSAVPANSDHYHQLQRHLKTYFEFPPLYRTAQTRWGDDWDGERYKSKEAVFEGATEGLFFEEAKDYTWLTFVELKV